MDRVRPVVNLLFWWMHDPICGSAKGTEGDVPRGTLLLDAAPSSFSGTDASVKTRELLGTKDNLRVTAHGVELVKLR
jgi:hypothetical protein